MMNEGEAKLTHDTLAAYISNRLAPHERAAVTRRLVRDPEARGLLAMAARALGMIRAGDRDQVDLESRDRRAERTGARRAPPREKNPRSERR